MKKHLALVDTDGEIQDTLEINEGEAISPAPLGTKWVVLHNITKDFHKDPERFNLNKNDIDKPVAIVLREKPSVVLTLSATKVLINDQIALHVRLINTPRTIVLNIDGTKTPVNDDDTISLVFSSEGVYKIYCENKEVYCPVVYIDVMD